MSTPFGEGIDELIAEGLDERAGARRRRARMAIAVSFAVLAVWLVYVSAAGHWDRVVDNWVAALTMVFGSFVAGSTPQGGGAVAFPVLTKIIEVDTSVARSFSLCIQTVGMGTAALAIAINRRSVEWRAVGFGIPFAIVGFVGGLFVLGQPDELFWPSRIPGAYVKVTFTLVIAAMAFVVYMSYRRHLLERLMRLPSMTRRLYGALAVTALIGGVASSLVGSGADVFIYIFLVVLLGVIPRVGVPSSVMVMAAVSIVGFFVLGVLDGQLDITLNAAGDVVAVGGEATPEPLPADRFDLFGLWLAAVPVVAFGAPLGSWVSSRITDRQLVIFVGVLAIAEVLTTAGFLTELHFNDVALMLYAVVGLAVIVGGLWLLLRHRREILGLGGVALDETFTRSRLDVGPRYREQLGAPDEPDNDPPPQDADDR